jgi:hypothetical protein
MAWQQLWLGSELLKAKAAGLSRRLWSVCAHVCFTSIQKKKIKEVSVDQLPSIVYRCTFSLTAMISAMLWFLSTK